MHTRKHTQMFIAEGKEPGGMDKFWYIHAVGYCTTMKTNKPEMKLINNVE